MNEQHCVRVCVCVCVCVCARVHARTQARSRERNHVSHLKGLVCVTFPLSAQCSIFLAQMHRTFGFACIQIVAKATILFYIVKTKKNTAQVESN